MILVIDVGNTNMTLGVYEGQSLKAKIGRASCRERVWYLV